MREKEIISEIRRREPELMELYRELYADLELEKRARHYGLTPPEKVQPPEAVAVLKAMINSYPFEDKFALEGIKSRYIRGEYFGTYVANRLRQMGLQYEDLRPYLRDYGWLKDQ